MNQVLKTYGLSPLNWTYGSLEIIVQQYCWYCIKVLQNQRKKSLRFLVSSIQNLIVQDFLEVFIQSREIAARMPIMKNQDSGTMIIF